TASCISVVPFASLVAGASRLPPTFLRCFQKWITQRRGEVNARLIEYVRGDADRRDASYVRLGDAYEQKAQERVTGMSSRSCRVTMPTIRPYSSTRTAGFDWSRLST